MSADDDAARLNGDASAPHDVSADSHGTWSAHVPHVRDLFLYDHRSLTPGPLMTESVRGRPTLVQALTMMVREFTTMVQRLTTMVQRLTTVLQRLTTIVQRLTTMVQTLTTMVQTLTTMVQTLTTMVQALTTTVREPPATQPMLPI